MQLTLTVVLIVLILVVLAFLVWLIVTTFAARKELAGHAAGISLLQQQLEALKASHDLTRESLQNSLIRSQTSLNENLQSSQKVLGQLNTQIGELQGTSKQMMNLGTDMRRLQDILSSPKLRGQMGEWSLKNLLEDILPRDNYQLQYAFKDGRVVDCVVKMTDYLVPIDAKFPLPAFERLLTAEDDDQKARLRKQFIRDVAIHIEKIASSYIRPAEGTLDFAMMYIPAENIYYETIVKSDGDSKDILQEALEKKVIPVSPNLLYAYLMTVVMGLHGLQIETQAAQILRDLKKLNSDFADFAGSWDTLGTHLRNSNNKYDEADKKLNKFGLHLEQLQSDQKEETQNSKNIKNDAD